MIERSTNYFDLGEARATVERLAEARGRRCRGRGHDDRPVDTRHE
jgi:hypothetical protein